MMPFVLGATTYVKARGSSATTWSSARKIVAFFSNECRADTRTPSFTAAAQLDAQLMHARMQARAAMARLRLIVLCSILFLTFSSKQRCNLRHAFSA
jgi:hypothetical protein